MAQGRPGSHERHPRTWAGADKGNQGAQANVSHQKRARNAPGSIAHSFQAWTIVSSSDAVAQPWAVTVSTVSGRARSEPVKVPTPVTSARECRGGSHARSSRSGRSPPRAATTATVSDVRARAGSQQRHDLQRSFEQRVGRIEQLPATRAPAPPLTRLPLVTRSYQRPH
jgi:hypothetical protein